MPLSLDSINAPYVEIFERADDRWDWRLVAGNGEIICSSFQGYNSKADAERGMARAKELLDLTTEVRTA